MMVMTTTRGRPRAFDRDEKLDLAVRLFWRQGYEGTSIRDLTTELGLAAPSLYSAFGGKQQLFDEAVQVYEHTYGGFIERSLTEESRGSDAAVRILREGPARYTRRGLPRGCLVTSGDAGATDEQIHHSLEALRQSKTDDLVAKIRGDVRRGELIRGADAAALGRYTMAVLSGLALTARDGVGCAALQRTAEVAVQAWRGFGWDG